VTAATAEDPAAAVLDQGSGPALLLLHGWGASKELMAPLAQRLRGYRVVAPDLPGFGATPPPPQAWGVDEYATWVIAVLDRLGIERAHVIGHSNGGRVAIAMAASHPHRVARLVLTDSAGVRPRPVNFTMDEPFEVERPATRVESIAVEVELHDVGGGDQRRRDTARQQEAAAFRRVTNADVPESVDHALVE